MATGGEEEGQRQLRDEKLLPTRRAFEGTSSQPSKKHASEDSVELAQEDEEYYDLEEKMIEDSMKFIIEIEKNPSAWLKEPQEDEDEEWEDEDEEWEDEDEDYEEDAIPYEVKLASYWKLGRELAEQALKFYNKNHGTSYELVEPKYYNLLLISELVNHVNFTAKLPGDSIKFFFAEVEAYYYFEESGEDRVVSCVIIEGEGRQYCSYCQTDDLVAHPIDVPHVGAVDENRQPINHSMRFFGPSG